MTEAVIFDMDGLILDSEILESQALIKILIANGKEPELYPNGLVHDIGGTDGDYYIKFKTKYNLPHDTAEISKQKRAHFEQLIKNSDLKPYDGFYELLEEIKNANFKLAVASNRFIGHINLILETLEVAEDFDVLVGPSETRRHKPHPDIYIETARLLQVKPENCIALEDTAKGVKAAKESGIKVIAVPNEYTKEHDFSEADKIVNSLKSVTIDMLNSL